MKQKKKKNGPTQAWLMKHAAFARFLHTRDGRNISSIMCLVNALEGAFTEGVHWGQLHSAKRFRI